MDEKSRDDIFVQAKSFWELRGWRLRQFRLQLNKTQIEFAEAAGWCRQYQSKIENSAFATFTSGDARDVIEAVFLRFQQADHVQWYANLKNYNEPRELIDKIFAEHKRYSINAEKLSNAVSTRASRRNFALLSGWSIDYIRKLCNGDIKVVSEQAATNIMLCLISLQDVEQV